MKQMSLISTQCCRGTPRLGLGKEGLATPECQRQLRECYNLIPLKISFEERVVSPSASKFVVSVHWFLLSCCSVQMMFA